MVEQQANTEDKIKEAARVLFLEKGFSATKTRDIAEAAGINLALLNYYFRSKQKLYNIIMEEALQKVFRGLMPILNEKETSVEEKLDKFVSHYIELVSQNPSLPNFILSNIQKGSNDFSVMQSFFQQARTSLFVKQFQEFAASKNIANVNPLHFLINTIALTVFPFLIKPLFENGFGVPQNVVKQLIEERKRLIPIWVKQMLQKE